MKSKSGLYVNIKESWYNKSKVQEDGITHIIDTSKSYPMYQLEIFQNYYVDTREQAVDHVIDDLRSLIQELEKLRGRENLDEERGGK